MSNRLAQGSASSTPKIARHLIAFVAVCLLVLAAVAIVGLALATSSDTESQLRSEIVELNQLAQTASTPQESQVISQAQQALRTAADRDTQRATSAIMLVFAVAALCLIALSLYLYRTIVRPFAKLQRFAEEVASGNLDLPLEYERSNPFGKFAWAFDHMRSELKRARAAERAAIEENKSVLASLAHDLRTPIASIRTYSEALSMGLESSPEERREYAEVIERRCIEVSQLVDDMLTHSLAELDRISVECSTVYAAPLLRQVIGDFGLPTASVAEIEDATISADELRLRQAIENLLVNASKYAPGALVEVSGRITSDGLYRITVRDFGPGMAPADIPFAFNRFYRGTNAKDVQGSGLGLYVVKYVIERMGGHALMENAHPGVSVTLDLPLENRGLS